MHAKLTIVLNRNTTHTINNLRAKTVNRLVCHVTWLNSAVLQLVHKSRSVQWGLASGPIVVASRIERSRPALYRRFGNELQIPMYQVSNNTVSNTPILVLVNWQTAYKLVIKMHCSLHSTLLLLLLLIIIIIIIIITRLPLANACIFGHVTKWRLHHSICHVRKPHATRKLHGSFFEPELLQIQVLRIWKSGFRSLVAAVTLI